MKLKKVAALCKKHKRAVIFQQWKYPSTGGPRYLAKQFISDGNAVWSAHGLPELTKESLLRIFDVKEEDFEKWRVSITELPDALEDLWEGVCTEVYIDGDGKARICFALHDYVDEYGPKPFDVYAGHYGKYIFHTKEEAEAALGGNGDG